MVTVQDPSSVRVWDIIPDFFQETQKVHLTINDSFYYLSVGDLFDLMRRPYKTTQFFNSSKKMFRISSLSDMESYRETMTAIVRSIKSNDILTDIVASIKRLERTYTNRGIYDERVVITRLSQYFVLALSFDISIDATYPLLDAILKRRLADLQTTSTTLKVA